ncbi:MAG: ABC transporter ATP-binding protein [Acidobacteria bacterium]|nr:ABC transporter ATP-binding protein [Acidobacteriota bacterium]
MDNALILRFTKSYPGGSTIEADLQLDTRRSSVTVLFGPSGSGKTTVLRCLAGLERPEKGVIRYGDEAWFDAEHGIALPPQRRRIGYLFQEYALFPHLQVDENIGYGLGRESKRKRNSRVAELMELFRLQGLENRYPRQLSGGQRQRVALARAVAPTPRLLLLDEPLSALDNVARGHLRAELRQLLLKVGVPALVVTHDRIEAITLGDQLAVVIDGRIEQFGPTQAVFDHPANRAVAQAVGVDTVLPAEIVGTDDGLVVVQTGSIRLYAVDTGESAASSVHLCIRAEEVMLERHVPEGTSARNHLRGRITSIHPEGPVMRVRLDCGIPLTAVVTRRAHDELNLRENEWVTATIKANSVHLVS